MRRYYISVMTCIENVTTKLSTRWGRAWTWLELCFLFKTNFTEEVLKHKIRHVNTLRCKQPHRLYYEEHCWLTASAKKSDVSSSSASVASLLELLCDCPLPILFWVAPQCVKRGSELFLTLLAVILHWLTAEFTQTDSRAYLLGCLPHSHHLLSPHLKAIWPAFHMSLPLLR